jgi:hypothetical protein
VLDQIVHQVASASLCDLEVGRLVKMRVELGISVTLDAPVVGAAISRLNDILYGHLVLYKESCLNLYLCTFRGRNGWFV